MGVCPLKTHPLRFGRGCVFIFRAFLRGKQRKMCGKGGALRQMDGFKRIFRAVGELYVAQRIPVAAAGLTYFLTLTFFPLLICLQAMLGSLFPTAEELRDVLALMLPKAAVISIIEYLRYVAANQSNALAVMALTMVASASSAAFRTVSRCIGDMRGRRRFNGLAALAFSFCFSLFFLTAIYFALILIATGKWFLDYVDRHIYFMNISDNWRWGRFFLLFLLLFALLSFVYRITAPRRSDVRLLPGAILASAALLVLSILFSAMIDASARYPMLYGSLASVIVLMLWLYAAGNILLLGAALNVALEQRK